MFRSGPGRRVPRRPPSYSECMPMLFTQLSLATRFHSIGCRERRHSRIIFGLRSGYRKGSQVPIAPLGQSRSNVANWNSHCRTREACRPSGRSTENAFKFFHCRLRPIVATAADVSNQPPREREDKTATDQLIRLAAGRRPVKVHPSRRQGISRKFQGTTALSVRTVDQPTGLVVYI